MTMQNAIEKKLSQALNPIYLSVENESHTHNVPPGSESHFKVVVVSEQFDNTTLVARHQSIYQLLQEELQGGVHALALHTYTAQEWAKQQEKAPASPACRGGGKVKGP